jgi:hypothetical protein
VAAHGSKLSSPWRRHLPRHSATKWWRFIFELSLKIHNMSSYLMPFSLTIYLPKFAQFGCPFLIVCHSTNEHLKMVDICRYIVLC